MHVKSQRFVMACGMMSQRQMLSEGKGGEARYGAPEEFVRGADGSAVTPPDAVRFELLFEVWPSALLLVDPERRISLMNGRAETLFGYRRDELVGSSLELLVPYETVHARHIPMGTSSGLCGRRKDGSELPVEIALRPVDTPEGPHVLASVVDLSERTSSDESFRLVLEASPNASLVVDATGHIESVNQRAVALFGRSRDALRGALAGDLFASPQGAPTLVEALRSAGPSILGGNRHLFATHLDGRRIPVEVTLSPLAARGAGFALASVFDLSERVRAEAVHERLAAIVEGSADAIVSTTLDGTIASWNQGARTLFGYTEAEALGQNIDMLIPASRRDHELELASRARAGSLANPFAAVRKRQDGSEVAVSVTLSPLRNSTGEVVGESKIARDMTELDRRAEELRRSNEELEQFAYVASHDLQEPLRMVANYTELLAQRYAGKLDERADKYIHYASDGARRMQRLVADLLAYSRVGSQGKPLLPVLCTSVVRDVLASLRDRIRESDATVVVGDLPTVSADEVQLAQLFQNLLSNALKFRSELAPHIEVKAEQQGEHWVFSVVDNGIGIEPAYVPRIFQMFQRLHERGKYEGSGIGLAIAKRIVERHGGRIDAAPNVGPGMTFTFTLPASRAAPPSSHT